MFRPRWPTPELSRFQLVYLRLLVLRKRLFTFGVEMRIICDQLERFQIRGACLGLPAHGCVRIA